MRRLIAIIIASMLIMPAMAEDKCKGLDEDLAGVCEASERMDNECSMENPCREQLDNIRMIYMSRFIQKCRNQMAIITCGTQPFSKCSLPDIYIESNHRLCERLFWEVWELDHKKFK